MSFGDWFSEQKAFGGILSSQKDAADYFLRTGNFLPILGGTSCRSAADCGSNFACVNGQCKNLAPQKISEDCGVGPKYCATECGQSTPGAECIASDCCGFRICRYFAGGVVCSCNEFPEDEKECNAFCTAYSQNNPNSPLPEGCSLDGNVCNECESCVDTFWSGTRCQLSNYGPCWCQEPGGRFCEVCTVNGTWELSPSCWTCIQQTKCEFFTGVVLCVPGFVDLSQVQEIGGTPLRLPCPPCKRYCGSQNFQEDGPYDPSYEPPCCELCKCVVKGYIRSDESDTTTYLVESCGLEYEINDSACSPPFGQGCSCHFDCGPAEKCDKNTLTCVPDPSNPLYDETFGA